MAMIIPVLWNEASSCSTIYKDMFKGICEAAKNRYEVRTYSTVASYLADEDVPDAIIVIAYETPTLNQSLRTLVEAGKQIVLAGLHGGQFGHGISSTTPNRSQATVQLLDYMFRCGRKKVALVGCDRNSLNDMQRISALESFCYANGIPNGGENAFKFQNNIQESFEAFYEKHNEFDGVICPNDYTALCFLRFCQGKGIRVPEDLYLAAFSNRFIGHFCKPGITTMAIDFRGIGGKAFLIWTMIQQHWQERLQIQISVPSYLIVRESTNLQQQEMDDFDFLTVEGGSEAGNVYGGTFYADEQIKATMQIENCLSNSTQQDLQIICHLLQGMSYEAISEQAYISVGTLNYRLRKIYQLAGVKGRKEFQSLFADFFTPENSF